MRKGLLAEVALFRNWNGSFLALRPIRFIAHEEWHLTLGFLGYNSCQNPCHDRFGSSSISDKLGKLCQNVKNLKSIGHLIER